MLENYMTQMNWIALLVAALAMFGVGSLWYSVLLGKPWMKELEKLGMKLDKPGGKEMMGMTIGSVLYNFLGALAVGYLIYISQTTTVLSAVKMGVLIGGCILWAGIGGTYIWEKRSMKNLVIDGSYHIVANVLCAVILTVWK